MPRGRPRKYTGAPAGYKYCNRCGNLKETTEFSPNPHTYDKLHGRCRDCRRSEQHDRNVSKYRKRACVGCGKDITGTHNRERCPACRKLHIKKKKHDLYIRKKNAKKNQ